MCLGKPAQTTRLLCWMMVLNKTLCLIPQGCSIWCLSGGRAGLCEESKHQPGNDLAHFLSTTLSWNLQSTGPNTLATRPTSEITTRQLSPLAICPCHAVSWAMPVLSVSHFGSYAQPSARSSYSPEWHPWPNMESSLFGRAWPIMLPGVVRYELPVPFRERPGLVFCSADRIGPTGEQRRQSFDGQTYANSRNSPATRLTDE